MIGEDVDEAVKSGCHILRARYTRTQVNCHVFIDSLCNVLFVQWTFDLID